MKISRLVALAAFAILLTGCQSVGERRAMDEQRCASYGFRPGGNAYANCLQRIDLDRGANARSLRYNTSVALGNDDWRGRGHYHRRDWRDHRPHRNDWRGNKANPAQMARGLNRMNPMERPSVCQRKSCR